MIDVVGLGEYRVCHGVHVSSGSTETLVRRGGITNHQSIAYSVSNMSAKNYENRLMCVEVTLCNISIVFDTQCINLYKYQLSLTNTSDGLHHGKALQTKVDADAQCDKLAT